MKLFGSDLQFKRNITFRGRLAYRFLGELFMGDRIRSMHIFRTLKSGRFISKDACILDTGCGQGAYSFYLKRRYPASHITGIELSEELVNEARNILIRTRLHNIKFLKADLVDLAEDEKYGYIQCIVVLEHIELDEKVLRNFYRAMKLGAILLVHVPKPLTLARIHFKRLVRPSHADHVRDGYTESEILEKIEAAGFKIKNISYPFGYWGSLARELSSVIKWWPLVLLTFSALMIMGMLDVISCRSDGNGILVTAVKKC